MTLKTRITICWSNNSIGSIAASVIADEVEKMERKDVCTYSLKRSEKVKTLPTNTFVKQ